MTEDEGELLHDICNQWFREFSALVNYTLTKAPDHLQNDLEDMLSERSSVFGRSDDYHFAASLPDTEEII